jgi:hypothetical protein
MEWLSMAADGIVLFVILTALIFALMVLIRSLRQTSV